MSEKEPTTRREMFCSVGRYVALGGLALGAVHLVAGNRGPQVQSRDRCIRQFKCSRCGLVQDCLLPEGVAARQNRTRSVSEGQDKSRSVREGQSG
jgi:hypothetical protein